MIVKSLSFENFRNLKNNTIFPCEHVNVIYGENAQGKTNLIEAIWLFCGGHSFRSSKENEMTGFEKDFFKLRMEFFCEDREQNADIWFAQNKKNIKINSVEKNSSAYLTEKFSAVVFSPEHLTLIKSGPQIRRKFIDAAVCQQKIRYASLLSKYQQILNQRNALLKDINRHRELLDVLSIWDDSLCFSGAQILKERIEYIRQIREKAREIHLGISHEKEILNITYLSTCDAQESDDINILTEKLKKAVEKSREEDIRFGNTSCGPHRDDLDITINDLSCRRYASQGQQRSAVLSLKLTEANLLFEKRGERPVILLDDVLSELDSKRQDFLLNKVSGYQVFVTCCEESSKEQLQNGKIFYVENGEIR
ncbi:MAG: DNA replication/repair protein RecF [Ruminococcus sp.]|nr:DNA replication/repair protein RecF [Ruminococcus sp.]